MNKILVVNGARDVMRRLSRQLSRATLDSEFTWSRNIREAGETIAGLKPAVVLIDVPEQNAAADFAERDGQVGGVGSLRHPALLHADANDHGAAAG